jgi:hypothetical protein
VAPLGTRNNVWAWFCPIAHQVTRFQAHFAPWPTQLHREYGLCALPGRMDATKFAFALRSSSAQAGGGGVSVLRESGVRARNAGSCAVGRCVHGDFHSTCRSVMRAEFARLVAAGHNPNRVTKLLLPILSGRDASSVVAEAEITLAGLSDGVDAASDGTSGVGGGAAGALPAPAPSSSPVPAAPLMRSGTAPAAASSATRTLLGTPSTLRSSSGGTPSASAAVDADIASGITIERMQGLYDDAASSGDYRPMVSVR